MNIKIEDYLNEQEIKEICKDALYQKIREDMRKLNVNDIIATFLTQKLRLWWIPMLVKIISAKKKFRRRFIGL